MEGLVGGDILPKAPCDWAHVLSSELVPRVLKVVLQAIHVLRVLSGKAPVLVVVQERNVARQHHDVAVLWSQHLAVHLPGPLNVPTRPMDFHPVVLK